MIWPISRLSSHSTPDWKEAGNALEFIYLFEVSVKFFTSVPFPMNQNGYGIFAVMAWKQESYSWSWNFIIFISKFKDKELMSFIISNLIALFLPLYPGNLFIPLRYLTNEISGNFLSLFSHILGIPFISVLSRTFNAPHIVPTRMKPHTSCLNSNTL